MSKFELTLASLPCQASHGMFEKCVHWSGNRQRCLELFAFCFDINIRTNNFNASVATIRPVHKYEKQPQLRQVSVRLVSRIALFG